MNKHGILALVHRVEGGPYFTISEVAEKVGRSTDTVRRWIRDDSVPKPSHKMDLGEKGWVWLYTQDDLELIQAYAMYVKPGRPRKAKK